MGKGQTQCDQSPMNIQVAIPGSRPGEIFYANAGIMDSDAQSAFSHGHCHSLALAVHRKTGWPMLGLSRHSRNGDLTHVVLEMPDGRWLDSRGPSQPDGGDVVEMDARQVISLGDHSKDWLSTDEQLAESFVEPLLELAGMSLTDPEIQPSQATA